MIKDNIYKKNNLFNCDLTWVMTHETSDGTEKRIIEYKFDLNELKIGYSEKLLLDIKSLIIKRRDRVSINTIYGEYLNIKSLMRKCLQTGCFKKIVEIIDIEFIRAIEASIDKHTTSSLNTIIAYYKFNRNRTEIFDKDLIVEYFPKTKYFRGYKGELLDNIISSALSRATVSQILTDVENSYENGDLDLSRYAFAMLAFQVFFRPSSYLEISLKDLYVNKNSITGKLDWFVDMRPFKTRVDNVKKISIKITNDLGEILQLQRQSVVKKYGYLVSEEDLGNLALFPIINKSRVHSSTHYSAKYAMCKSSAAFTISYLNPIKKLTKKNFGFNALRHTIGTQLAISGLSASRIAAVLRHATDQTCSYYVDLFFKGVLDRISDSMQTSFDEHFPVYKEIYLNAAINKNSKITRKKSIIGEDLTTGHREVIAECGRESICGYAPLACYECNKFRPFWDADHSVNLNLVDREISFFENKGLALQHEAKKYKRIRNMIRIVMNICEIKSQSENSLGDL